MLCFSGELSDREKYFASAALCWSVGQYSRAACLLESSSLASPDLLAIRLAVEAQSLSRDCAASLSTISRHAHRFKSTEGELAAQGLLAYGLVNAGRLVEAEQVAEQTINRSVADFWSVVGMLRLYLQMGRSSEVVSLTTRLEGDMTGEALHILAFYKGMGQVQRGLHKSALMQVSYMLEILPDPLHTQSIRRSLEYLTLLMWSVSLNLMDVTVQLTWNRLLLVWQDVHNRIPGDATAGRGTELTLLCGFLLNKYCSVPLLQDELQGEIENDNAVQSISADRGNSSNSGGGGGGGGMGSLGQLMSWVRKNEGGAKAIANAEAGGAPHARHGAIENPQARAEEILGRLQHLSTEKSVQQGEKAWLEACQKYPVLSSVSPVYPGLVSPACPGDLRDPSPMHSLAVGLGLFVDEEYSLAADQLFRSKHAISANTLAVDPEVAMLVDFTLMEALLRSNRLLEADSLLSQRVCLVPGDAQTWRRIATCHGRLGWEQSAQSAHYTSWELGVGQGGFQDSR